MSRKWTGRMDAKLRRWYPSCACPEALAAELGVTPRALKSRAGRLGVARADRRCWPAADKALLRAEYGRTPGPLLAARLGRPAVNVYRMATVMGLARKHRTRTGEEWQREVRRLNAAGRNDREIAAALGCDASVVGRFRRKHSLPDHSHGEAWRAQQGAARAKQCAALGVASLGAMRSQAYRRYAAENGWPDDLAVRAVQVLNALAASGVPMTKRELAEAVGVPWRGSKATLGNNGPKGPTLAVLASRGLLLRLACAGPDGGHGRRVDLYALGHAALAILADRARKQTEEAS